MWYQRIKDKYPNLYPPNFHFECGEGWSKILEDLSDKISKVPIEIKASQVKEKIGGLRFYYDSWPPTLQIPDDVDLNDLSEKDLDQMEKDQRVQERYGAWAIHASEIDSYIADAETESLKTCEVCGEPGTRGRSYWISTLCEKHKKS